MSCVPLSALAYGQCATVLGVNHQNEAYERLLTLGFTKNSKVTCLFSSAFGEPKAYQIKDTVVALRKNDASQVYCERKEL